MAQKTSKLAKQQRRAARKRKQTDRQLAKRSAKMAQLEPLPPKDEALLKSLYGNLQKISGKKGRFLKLSPKDRKVFLDYLEKRVIQGFSDPEKVLGPQDFGAKTPREFAHKLLEILEKTGIHAKTFQEFLHDVRGYKGNINGALWHLLVENLEPLQNDLMKLARNQVKIFNTFTTLVNARGKVLVRQKAIFGKVEKATNFILVTKDGPKPYTDFAYVSLGTSNAYSETVAAARVGAAPGSRLGAVADLQERAGLGIVQEVPTRRVVTIAVGVENKLPFGKARKQLGESQIRLSEADQLLFTINGKEYYFSPEDIVFSPISIPKAAITTSSSGDWARIMKLAKSGDAEAKDILAAVAKSKNLGQLYGLTNYGQASTTTPYSSYDWARIMKLAKSGDAEAKILVAAANSFGAGETFMKVSLLLKREHFQRFTNALFSR
jgi:hypothetical protein